MTFPTPWTVTVYRPLEGEDVYGNDLEGHDLARPDRQKVYGWAPAGTSEEGGWRTQVEADLHLYAPPEFRCSPFDLVVIDGDQYHVEGQIEDFTRGPFGYRPGVRINLNQVSG